MQNNNPMAQYMNKSLKGIIADIQVVQGTVKDTGNIYYCVELSFINGYNKRLFLKSDEQFAWTNAMEMLETQKQVDAAF